MKAPTTLRYLTHNKWLTVKEKGQLTIRLGERAKKLRERTPTATTLRGAARRRPQRA